MTPAELLTMIQSDAEAAELFVAGNDSACAVRCSVIAPKITRETRLSRLGILSLYSNPADGATVLGTLDAVSAGNAIIAEIRSFLGPGVHPSCLPDWSLASIRAALTVPIVSGGLGLSAELAAPIIAAAEHAQTFSHIDVAAARQSQG